ncbi:MAG: restriction endonuclease subunit S [Bacteroidales bacterium]|nr:restriction endonuclease subunit S [Bacteroidales bacterium]
MSEWKKVKLGELYEVHNGLSKGRQFFGSGYPFLSFSTVFNNWFLPKELDSLVQSSDKEREACSIKKGDVFITRTSETMDELGMSSVALKDYPNATYNGFTKRLRPITDEVVPEYIGYYLRSKKFRAKFMAFSSMTTRASLANDDLLGMEVEIPDKTIQIRIATILSRYDSLIENYQKQIKLLEEAAQRLYKEWFVELRFPGHENTKMVDGLPEGWERKKLVEVLEYYDKQRKPLSSMQRMDMVKIYPYYGAATLMDYVDNYLFDGIYLLLGEDGTVITPDNYPVLQYVWGKFWVNNHAHVLRGKNGISTEYLYSMFKEMPIADVVTGAAQPKISQGRLSEKKIVVPPTKLITKWSETTKAYFDSLRNHTEEIRLLTEARDRLLPKLMGGGMAM